MPSEFDRRQLIALIRDISFHREGRRLRAIVRRLARAGAKAPTRAQLATSLPAWERPMLARYIAMLNRLAAKAAPEEKLRLCQLDRATGGIVVNPATQRALRELLSELDRSGEHEEPLWEQST